MTVYEAKTMQICEIKENTVVALGTFDGCHSGHASVLQNAFYKAKALGLKSVAYTFDTVAVKGQELIMTLDEKIKAIRKFGVDYIAVEDFERVRSLSGEEFFDTVLTGELCALYATCGFNYRFGKGASCSAEDMNGFFEKIGGSVCISPKITAENEAISSTLIREKIKQGDVESILGFSSPYSIYAEVIRGKGMGKGLGMATVNQQIPSGKVVPLTGVYITECQIGEDVYPSVTNVGYRPTTDGENDRLNVETHIIGYDGELYGSCLRVAFYKRLRDEKRFGSFEELVAQVELDKNSAVDYFLH